MAVTEGIVAAGGEAVQAVTDVTSRADLATLVALARERFGRLDVLVSNAGALLLLRAQRHSCQVRALAALTAVARHAH